MASAPTSVKSRTPACRALTIEASAIARVHTYLSFAAFLSALVIGSALHYKKIVKNGVAGYPHEWFPSVSATIGDWYPERNVFQIFIAINAGPRFALVFLQYLLTRSPSSSLPLIVFITGLVRTLSCGGWVYITSSDDHDAHDVLMITYIVCNIPWMFGGIACTPVENVLSRRRRTMFATIFFVSIVPMVFFFIRHKVHRIPGAYTHYSFFEWGLIFMDILYDSVNELDFAKAGTCITIDFAGEAAPIHVVSQKGSNASNSAKTTTPEPTSSSLSVQDKEHVDTKIASPPLVGSISPKLKESYKQYRPAVSFTADVYLAYIFWSISTSLAPTLFYFSIWELGIAGSELSLLSILSPCLLGISPFRQWCQTRSGRVVLHMLSSSALFAYALPKPQHRLVLVAAGNIFLCIGAAIDWSGASGTSVEYQATQLGLGLLLSSVSKQANHSNNPLWPLLNERSGGYNKTGIILAILAIYEFATRPAEKAHTPPRPAAEEAAQQGKMQQDKTQPRRGWLLAAAPLGSLIFGLHCYLSDPSTLIVWSWTGYPIRGPVPHIHGSLTIVAQAIGLLLGIFATGSGLHTVTGHPLWLAFGAFSTYILYTQKDWVGYAGGLSFSVFWMSIIPRVLLHATTGIDSRTGSGSARIYFGAFLTLILLLLANVWTVAYAFVPGGEYLRERTDLVLATQTLLLLPAVDWRNVRLAHSSQTAWPWQKTRSYASATLALICITTGLVSLYHTPIQNPQPHRSGPRIIRAGIWTVHFGLDNTGRDSQRGMRELIKDMELDLVGLLETDLHRIVYGNRDLTRVLVEDLGYYVDVGPGPNQHTWGAVLLSKFPILQSTHHLLPSPHGELAPAISAVLDVWGTNMTVIVAHNGQEEDPLDRELQSIELARIMSSTYPGPLIFLGYVVTKPHARKPNPYEILVSDGRVHDIEDNDYDRWCEYILYRGLYRTSFLRMSRGSITDTELQVGQFVVPKFGHSVVGEWGGEDERRDATESKDAKNRRYLRIRKEVLPVEHWFPMEYYGDKRKGGKNGHFYHVFGTPLYYNIPEDAVV